MNGLRLERLSWHQARDLLRRPDCVGLLPIGATEAHGPHLPLFTDNYLSDELCQRIAAALRGRCTCVILPALTTAVTTYAAGFAGSIDLRVETARSLLEDMLSACSRHGPATVALINSHLEPGHIQLLQEAAAAPRDRPRVLFVNHCRKPWALELGNEFKSGDCHAGRYETSLLLASHWADAIDATYRQLPPVQAGLVAKMKAGVRAFDEMGADQAYFGEPAQASAEEGERLWSVLVRMWVESILRHHAEIS
ncbi:MAG: creatininase family protein [Phycisphaerae bacterium]|nr:creatininase family protein [Phycisphaerae bacterium]NUQ44608.1 creatininase family protein [Phycisphaerae bacterium]